MKTAIWKRLLATVLSLVLLLGAVGPLPVVKAAASAEMTIVELSEAYWLEDSSQWAIVLGLAEPLEGVGAWESVIYGMTYSLNGGEKTALIIEAVNAQQLFCTIPAPQNLENCTITIGGSGVLESSTNVILFDPITFAQPVTLVGTADGWVLKDAEAPAIPAVQEMIAVGIAEAYWNAATLGEGNPAWVIALNLAEQLEGGSDLAGAVWGLTYSLNGEEATVYTEIAASQYLYFYPEVPENPEGYTLTVSGTGVLEDWNGDTVIESLTLTEPITLVGTADGWTIKNTQPAGAMEVAVEAVQGTYNGGESQNWGMVLYLAEPLEGVEPWTEADTFEGTFTNVFGEEEAVYYVVGDESAYLYFNMYWVPETVDGLTMTLSGTATTADGSKSIQFAEPVTLVGTADGWALQATAETAVPEIKSANLVLNSILSLNITADLNGEDPADYEMYVTVGNDSEPQLLTAPVEKDGGYVYTARLLAHRMHEAVAIQLVKGGEVKASREWTLATYIDKLNAEYPDNTAMADLLVALSNYGSYADSYEDAALSGLNIEAVAKVQAADLSDYALDIGTANTALQATASLYLDDACDLRFKFNKAAMTGLTLYVDGEQQSVEDYGTEQVIYSISSILPQNWDQLHSVVVKNGETVVYELSHGVLSYAYQQLKRSADAELKGLLAAMYLYNVAADAYIPVNETFEMTVSKLNYAVWSDTVDPDAGYQIGLNVYMELTEALEGVDPWSGAFTDMTYSLDDGEPKSVSIEYANAGTILFVINDPALSGDAEGKTLVIDGTGKLNSWAGDTLMDSVKFAEPVKLIGTADGWELYDDVQVEPEASVVAVNNVNDDATIWDDNGYWNIYFNLSEALEADDWEYCSGMTYAIGDGEPKALTLYGNPGDTKLLCMVIDDNALPQNVAVGTTVTIDGVAERSGGALFQFAEPITLVKTQNNGWDILTLVTVQNVVDGEIWPDGDYQYVMIATQGGLPAESVMEGMTYSVTGGEALPVLAISAGDDVHMLLGFHSDVVNYLGQVLVVQGIATNIYGSIQFAEPLYLTVGNTTADWAITEAPPEPEVPEEPVDNLLTISDLDESGVITVGQYAGTKTYEADILGKSFKAYVSYSKNADATSRNTLYYGASAAEFKNCVTVRRDANGEVWITLWNTVGGAHAQWGPFAAENGTDYLIEIDISEPDESNNGTVTVKFDGTEVIDWTGDISWVANQLLFVANNAVWEAVYTDYEEPQPEPEQPVNKLLTISDLDESGVITVGQFAGTKTYEADILGKSFKAYVSYSEIANATSRNTLYYGASAAEFKSCVTVRRDANGEVWITLWNTVGGAHAQWGPFAAENGTDYLIEIDISEPDESNNGTVTVKFDGTEVIDWTGDISWVANQILFVANNAVWEAVYTDYEEKEAEEVKIIADIAIPETGIVNPAVVVTNVESQNTYENLTGSAVALLNVDASLNILDSKGMVISTVEEYMAAYKNTVIPAFQVDSTAEVTAICTYLAEHDIRDAFYITDSAALLKSARTAWPYARGILVYDALPDTLKGQGADRRELNNNLATIAVYPAEGLNADIVSEYNLRGISVWSYAENKADVYTGISNGANGLIAASPDTITEVYESITAKTLSGKPVAIAHRSINGNTAYVEQTLGAMSDSVALGCTALEMDIVLTQDKQLVVIGGDEFNKINPDSTKTHMSAYTLAEIKEMGQNAATPREIASLREVFDVYKNTNIALYLHINYITANAGNYVENYTEEQINALHSLVAEYEQNGDSIADNLVIFFRGGDAATYRGEQGIAFIGGTYMGDGKNHWYWTADRLADQYTFIYNMSQDIGVGNTQELPYQYTLQDTDGNLAYRMSARGYLTLQTCNYAETKQAQDDYFINKLGGPAVMTNHSEYAGEYSYQLNAEDLTVAVGQTIDLNKIATQVMGNKEVSCGLIWLSGTELTQQGAGYTMATAGTATVVYYADITIERDYGTLTYRIYSMPVTITAS